MSMKNLIPAIDGAMRRLGFESVGVASGGPFGNGAAEYSDRDLDFLITIDRDSLELEVRPCRGIAAWRWYDANALFKKLEASGHPVCWASGDSPEEIEQYLSQNIQLLRALRPHVRFSYFDGVDLKK